MGLGIRLSMGLREIESFPLHRFKVDFRVVEFPYHRYLRNCLMKISLGPSLSWGNSVLQKGKVSKYCPD